MSSKKENIRARVQRRRTQYDLADLQRAGSRITMVCEIVLRLLKPSTLMCYVSKKGEAPTHEIIHGAMARGHRVCVPRFEPKSGLICASELQNFTRDLERGYKGLLEPHDSALRPIDPSAIDVNLVPGLAFDPLGGRLGRGAGAYDRFLSLCNPNMVKVGLAFAWQLVKDVPAERHDIPMDLILTDEAVIPIKPGILEG